MKKLLKLLVCIALFAALSLSFASCDDEPTNDGSSDNDSGETGNGTGENDKNDDSEDDDNKDDNKDDDNKDDDNKDDDNKDDDNKDDDNKDDDNKDDDNKDDDNKDDDNKEDDNKDDEIIDSTVVDFPNFDYIKTDLRDFVIFSEDDYKNYSVSINIARPHAMDVDVAILNLLASYKGKVKNDGAMMTSPVTISAGDKVKIWYRGYLLDDNGEEVFMTGMCNFSGSDPAELEIGSGQFVPGFELNLVGKNTGDYPKFTKITEGEIKETQIAYVSYKRLVEGGDVRNDTERGLYVRIDLSDESIDGIYGAGFRAQLLSANVGETLGFDVTLDGKTHNYTETTVNFVTECEIDPMVVECYFPYDYSNSTLRNKTAYFEVYVNGVIQYECPEFTDDFVLSWINSKGFYLTEAELLAYEGDTLTEKFRSYLEKILEDNYLEEYKTMVEDAMWNHYLEKAEIKKYPKAKVDEIYAEYVEDVHYQFDQTGGSLQNPYTGEYVTYEDIDSFAVAYLGLTYSENKDWKATLYQLSKNLVKERLILYYIMQLEELLPTEEELADEVSKIKQEYVNEYVNQYLEYENKNRGDFTSEEFAEYVKEREEELFTYYSEEYFVETAYYEMGLEEMIKWPEVKTFD